jgi:hypothetical protein
MSERSSNKMLIDCPQSRDGSHSPSCDEPIADNKSIGCGNVISYSDIIMFIIHIQLDVVILLVVLI